MVLIAGKCWSDRTTMRLLIVGDSIGEGAGSSHEDNKWYNLLIPYLEEQYEKNIKLTNVSMGGNTSYAGYSRVNMLKAKEDFDMVIICYGQNDQLEEFSFYYELLIREICESYPNSQMIAVLESSQREYTEKMQIIQNLCDYYGIAVADTIASFAESGKIYEELCDDGTHPNDEGQKVYFETVREVIAQLQAENTGISEIHEAIDTRVSKYDDFKYLSIRDFKKLDQLTYEISITEDVEALGLDYTLLPGEKGIKIYIDENTEIDRSYQWNYSFGQRHIEVISGECDIQQSIRLVFSDEEQKEVFHGLILN